MRLLVYLVELIFIAVLAGWFFLQPGSITIDLWEYHFEAQLAVAFLALIVLFIIAGIIFKAWRFILFFPSRILEGARRMRPKKGMQALNRAALATYLQDSETARQEAKKFERFLGENPIYWSLLVYNYLNDGRMEEALSASQAMKNSEMGEDLSWYFQARIAIIEKKDMQALECLQRLFANYNKSPWVIKNLLKYSLKLQQFAIAQQALKKAERLNLFTRQTLNQYQSLILLYQSKANNLSLDQKEDLLERAHRLSPELTQVAIQYAKVLKLKDKNKRARKMIEYSWSFHPHIDLLEEYLAVDAATSTKDIMETVDHLISNNPNDQRSYLSMAKIALKYEQWGRARAALHSLKEQAGTTQELCHLMAQLELSEHGDNAGYREWMERALKSEKTKVEEISLESLFA